MLAKRIIPCLDVAGGRVVKGIHFVDLKDAGDPVELGYRYYREGADELVFLDITATVEERKTVVNWVRRVADSIFIPFTVGGGISTIEQIQELLRAGADKVSINSAAVRHPDLLREAALAFGSQCIVLAVDAKRTNNGWRVFINGGRLETDRDALEWIRLGEELGAGEILLTSMDRDGTQEGYDLELLQTVSGSSRIPLIASGGAGCPQHLLEGLEAGGADAVLAASIFHYDRYSIAHVKEYLARNGVVVRRQHLGAGSQESGARIQNSESRIQNPEY
ncbi:MAG: imidazole glycerol phosphate synthase subunit HisF [Acidobacteriota bacterium]